MPAAKWGPKGNGSRPRPPFASRYRPWKPPATTAQKPASVRPPQRQRTASSSRLPSRPPVSRSRKYDRRKETKSRANGRKGSSDHQRRKRTPFPEPSRHPGWYVKIGPYPQNEDPHNTTTTHSSRSSQTGSCSSEPSPSARRPTGGRKEGQPQLRQRGSMGTRIKELRLLRHQRPACRRQRNPHLAPSQ